MKEFARNMDSLGRIVIPMEIRRENHINEGDLLGVKVTGDGILLFKINKTCAICGSNEDLILLNGQTQCRQCITQFHDVLTRSEGDQE